MALIAAVLFGLAFIFQIAGIALGPIGAFALVCLGLVFLALASTGFGAGLFGRNRV